MTEHGLEKVGGGDPWPRFDSQRKRHPAEVTADRLAEHIEKYHAKLDGAERDEFSRVRFILYDIAEGHR